MRNILIKPASPLRKFFPFIQKLRGWALKFYDRTGVRLVISGGHVRFMDAGLKLPETVGLTYATLLFWNGPDVCELPTSREAPAVIEELDAAAFAIMSDGFFCMHMVDFSRPRGGLKDFLPAPREKISPGIFSRALEDAGEIFSA